jgi:beta-1,4-mannosyltransferase
VKPANRRRPIRVIAWPAFLNREENPYNYLLYTSLAEYGVRVKEFTVQRLLFGQRADILHLHWSPTSRIRGRTRARVRRLSAQMLLLMLAAKIRGMKVVWTVHNIEAHDTQSHPDIEARYWPRIATYLSALISLSAYGVEAVRAKYPSLNSVPSFVTAHGHYRDAYPRSVSRDHARSRLGISPEAKVIVFVGQVRPYKNVPALVNAFTTLEDSNAVLLIAGKIKSGAHRGELEQLFAADPRIRAITNFIPRDEMQFYLQAADLVVLPFRDILNSGSAVLALSFDKPVLVPRAGALVELASQIGDDWVMTYDGHLTPEILEAALGRAQTMRGRTAPLEPLSWSTVARQTSDIYRSLVEA